MAMGLKSVCYALCIFLVFLSALLSRKSTGGDDRRMEVLVAVVPLVRVKIRKGRVAPVVLRVNRKIMTVNRKIMTVPEYQCRYVLGK